MFYLSFLLFSHVSLSNEKKEYSQVKIEGVSTIVVESESYRENKTSYCRERSDPSEVIWEEDFSSAILDKETWRIDFDYVANGVEVAGIPLGAPQKKPFEAGKETRLWKITYLDDNLRVLRARRLEASEKDSSIFVLKRVDNLPLDASKI